MNRSLALTLHPLVSLVILTAITAAGTATPAPPVPCPVTQPNGDMPTGSGNPDSIGGYGNDALWTNLWMWGDEGVVLPPDDEHMQPDGAISQMKWAWYRYVPGALEVEGRRLHAPAPPLEAWIPAGYGNLGFQVTGLTFPTIGCWEITGRVGEASLTFVVMVELSASAATPATAP